MGSYFLGSCNPSILADVLIGTRPVSFEWPIEIKAQQLFQAPGYFAKYLTVYEKHCNSDGSTIN